MGKWRMEYIPWGPEAGCESIGLRDPYALWDTRLWDGGSTLPNLGTRLTDPTKYDLVVRQDVPIGLSGYHRTIAEKSFGEGSSPVVGSNFPLTWEDMDGLPCTGGFTAMIALGDFAHFTSSWTGGGGGVGEVRFRLVDDGLVGYMLPVESSNGTGASFSYVEWTTTLSFSQILAEAVYSGRTNTLVTVYFDACSNEFGSWLNTTPLTLDAGYAEIDGDFSPVEACSRMLTDMPSFTGIGMQLGADIRAFTPYVAAGERWDTIFGMSLHRGKPSQLDVEYWYNYWFPPACGYSYVTYLDSEVPGVGDGAKTTLTFPDDWVNPAVLAPVDDAFYVQQAFTLDGDDYLVSAVDDPLTDIHEMAYMTLDQDLDATCNQYIEVWVAGINHDFDGDGVALPEGERTNGSIEMYVHGSATTKAKQGLYFQISHDYNGSGDADDAHNSTGTAYLYGESIDDDGNYVDSVSPFGSVVIPNWWTEPFYKLRLEADVDGAMRLYFNGSLIASGTADIVQTGPLAGVATDWYTSATGPSPRISRIEVGTLA